MFVFMSKKKFLLVCPSAFHLYELIVRNLAHLGYEVTHIEDEGYEFSYRSFGERAYNFLRKVFLGDKTYKTTLRSQYTSFQQWSIFKSNAPFDYTLVIRPDLFDKQLIEAIKHKTELMIGYQFDGISRNPEVLDYISLFDRFYVFDPTDVTRFSNHNLIYSPNFYLDYPDVDDEYIETEKYSIFYVSTFHESRVGDLIFLHKLLGKIYNKIKFCVLIQPERVDVLPEYVVENMEVIHRVVNYEEHLRQVAHSEIIVDLVISEHRGFSFRIMEGIKFGKKVITTNDKIRDADFYHPHNFYILRPDNVQDLKEFLAKPYVPLDQEMRSKYGFTAWLQSKITV